MTSPQSTETARLYRVPETDLAKPVVGLDGAQSTLDRGLRILTAFQVQPGPMSNSALSAITKLPKATVSRLVSSLISLGYVARLENNTFELTSRTVSLAYPFMATINRDGFLRGYLNELASLGGVVVGLAVPDRSDMVYLDAAHATKKVSLRMAPGARVPIAKTATGHAYFCSLDDAARTFLKREFRRKYRDEWPSLCREIENSETQIASNGLCHIRGTWREDTQAIAACIEMEDQNSIVINCAAENSDDACTHLIEKVAPILKRIKGDLGQNDPAKRADPAVRDEA